VVTFISRSYRHLLHPLSLTQLALGAPVALLVNGGK